MPLFGFRQAIRDLLSCDIMPDYDYSYHDSGLNQDDDNTDDNNNQENPIDDQE